MDSPLEPISVSFDRQTLISVCSSNVVKNNEISVCSGSIVVENNDNYDVLVEILMRVDPCNIFKCILVSKYWLSVITSPLFRANYLKTWKNSYSKVVGFLFYKMASMCLKQSPGVQFLPTSNLGLELVKNSMPGSHIGFFISKSTNGILLFGGIDQKTLYIIKVTGGAPVQLPPPPAKYNRSVANILSSSDSEDFRVILGWGIDEGDNLVEDTKVSIQTFSSRTWKWELSTIPCSTSLIPSTQGAPVEGGTVTKGGGVIYWKAVTNCTSDYLAAWDINGGCISVIPKPPIKMDRKCDAIFCYSTTYGVSPQGSLLAATCSYHPFNHESDWKSEWFTINIWAFDDDDKDWYFLHGVRHASIWTNNLAVLKLVFEVRPKRGFRFVSFVPGKSDSVYVRLEHHLFVYHFHTGKLEYVEYLKYGFTIKFFEEFVTYHPLTMLDLGIWPFSPPSLASQQLPHCS